MSDGSSIPFTILAESERGQDWTVLFTETPDGDTVIIHLHREYDSLVDGETINVPMKYLMRINNVQGVMAKALWISPPKSK